MLCLPQPFPNPQGFFLLLFFLWSSSPQAAVCKRLRSNLGVGGQMENKWQVPGDAPSLAAVTKVGAPPLTHSANFPESRDAPRSRKRSGNRRANVCKLEPGLRSVELPPEGPAGRCHPRRPRTGRASPSPRDAGLSLGPRARTCHGPPRSKDGEGDREKPKDGCAGRFLPARCKTSSGKLGQNPPKTPSQACPLPAHGSWVSSQGWPHRMSPPRSSQHRGRRLQSASEGVACFHLPAYGTRGRWDPAGLQKSGSRGRAAKAGSDRSALARRFVWDPEEKQQELFQALRLRRKSSPIRRLQRHGRQPGVGFPPPPRDPRRGGVSKGTSPGMR